MTYYAVYATSRRPNPYVAFSVVLVENWSELDILFLMWPQFVITRSNGSYCMFMEYFWPHSRLRVSLIEICSNRTENHKTSQTRFCWDKYGPNLSYRDSVTNTQPLYATLELIWPIPSQSAVHAITWNIRPRSLNSALKWTNSIKHDILDHGWPPLFTTDHTWPVNAILCGICH